MNSDPEFMKSTSFINSPGRKVFGWSAAQRGQSPRSAAALQHLGQHEPRRVEVRDDVDLPAPLPEIIGGVESATLFTVMLMALDPVLLPAASLAMAVRVCTPFVVAAVFQEVE